MSRESGFTLIEVLIVLAILAGLMTGVLLIIPYVQEKQKITETTNLIAQIEAALALVEAPQNLGEFPPTSPHDLKIGRKSVGKKIGAPNDTNAGIETLTLVLFLDGIDVGRVDTKYLINTDHDEAAEKLTIHEKLDLFEIRDAWDRPLIYVHRRDYERAGNGFEYVLPDGGIYLAVPKKDPVTGSYYKLDSYQIWSMGPEPDDDSDDIATFLD